jgi:hypothetical protein
MNWTPRSIPISNLLPLNNNLQLMVYISDLAPNINVTEASFDRFSISNYSILDTKELNKDEIQLFPNPTNHNIIIQGLELGNSLVLFDLKGNSLVEIKYTNEKEIINLSQLSEGMYFVKYKGKSYKLIKN